MAELSGVLCVNKPAGMTSHDVVGRVRRLYGTKQVGHTGTLDPMATGVLVVLVGRAVKASSFLSVHHKTYRVGLTLGLTTDTQDTTGRTPVRLSGPAARSGGAGNGDTTVYRRYSADPTYVFGPENRRPQAGRPGPAEY